MAGVSGCASFVTQMADTASWSFKEWLIVGSFRVILHVLDVIYLQLVGRVTQAPHILAVHEAGTLVV